MAMASERITTANFNGVFKRLEKHQEYLPSALILACHEPSRAVLIGTPNETPYLPTTKLTDVLIDSTAGFQQKIESKLSQFGCGNNIGPIALTGSLNTVKARSRSVTEEGFTRGRALFGFRAKVIYKALAEDAQREASFLHVEDALRLINASSCLASLQNAYEEALEDLLDYLEP